MTRREKTTPKGKGLQVGQTIGSGWDRGDATRAWGWRPRLVRAENARQQVNRQRSALVATIWPRNLLSHCHSIKRGCPHEDPTELARASCSSLEGYTHAFFHTGWFLMQSVVSLRLLLPANDSSWTKTEYYIRQWGFLITPSALPNPRLLR